MKCESCANQEICTHYVTINSILNKLDFGVNIIVEINVTSCQYYLKQKEPESPFSPILKLLEEQPDETMDENILLIELVKDAYPDERIARAKLRKAFEEGYVYRPKSGYLRKT